MRWWRSQPIAITKRPHETRDRRRSTATLNKVTGAILTNLVQARGCICACTRVRIGQRRIIRPPERGNQVRNLRRGVSVVSLVYLPIPRTLPSPVIKCLRPPLHGKQEHRDRKDHRSHVSNKAAQPLSHTHRPQLRAPPTRVTAPYVSRRIPLTPVTQSATHSSRPPISRHPTPYSAQEYSFGQLTMSSPSPP